MAKRRVARSRVAQPIQLVLLDEHPLSRAGLRNILEAERDISVVAEAATIDQAVAACRRHQPDVVLMDLDLPPRETIQSIRRLRRECTEGGVVVLSHADSDAELYQAALAGAVGHIADAVQPAELAMTIRRAAGGEEPIGQALARRPSVSRRVLESFRELAAQGTPHALVSMPSQRQLDILRHAADGQTNQQIARRLGLSTSTVRAEISSVLRSFGLRHRTQAVVLAVRQGWISPPRPPRPS